MNHNMRQVGAALGLPLELFAKDFSQTNYSSARAAMIEARRVFQQTQHALMRSVLTPMWNLVFEEGYLRGYLGTLPGADADLGPWCKARWVPPGYGWVDPVKEISASQSAIEVGVSTLSDEAAAQGRDWEEVLEQQAREKQRRLELGLFPNGVEPNNSEEEQNA
jgi:capsid protein